VRAHEARVEIHVLELDQRSRDRVDRRLYTARREKQARA